MSIKEFVAGREYEITGCSNYHGFAIGSRVTALAPMDERADVWRCGGWWRDGLTAFYVFRHDVKEIEVSVEQEEKIVEKVKIGDTLVITKRMYGHEFRLGERVTVLHIDEEDSKLPWDVSSDSGERWWVGPEEVELAFPVETALEKATPASDVPKLPAYAVLKEGVVRWITTSRDEARGVKAVLGGKAEGAVLYKLTVEKEVR